MSADPPLAVLSPFQSCQQIHLLQSSLHFSRVSRSTSYSPVSTSVVSPLAVLSPLQSCQQIHLSQSCLQAADSPLAVHSVVSADPPLADHFSHVSRSTSRSSLQSCQQIHLSQSCLHFSRVSRSPLAVLSPSVVSADPPLAVLSPLQSCQLIYL